MKNRERFIILSVFVLLIFTWLGFLLHVSPRFAGSAFGGIFGIAGAVLMLVPLTYTLAKRVTYFKQLLTRSISLQSWMSIHLYTGIAGAFFAIIHTGHKYQSSLGIGLTATMMLVIVSGIVLRYLSPFVNLDLKDKLLLLQTARGDLDSAWGALEASPDARRGLPKFPWLTTGLASLGLATRSASAAGQVITLAEGVADLEYSIRTHELLKRWFSHTLKVHIVLAVVMYALLAAHVASGIYFGLRWFL